MAPPDLPAAIDPGQVNNPSRGGCRSAYRPRRTPPSGSLPITGPQPHEGSGRPAAIRPNRKPIDESATPENTRSIGRIFALAASPARVNLILDGGFEAPNIGPSSFITYPASDSALAPWVIDANTVDIVKASGSGTPYEGAQFLDLDGTSAGQITQSFSTVVGLEYVLRFVYANDTLGASSSATVSVFSGVTTILNQTITHR